ncbi:hypothetical protein [Desulfatiferula olefinivorans]
MARTSPLIGEASRPDGAGGGRVPSALRLTRLKYSVSAKPATPRLSYQDPARKFTATSPTWGKVPVTA